jgi:putative membrane protein
MAALGETEGKAADLSLSVMSVVKLFLVGIIASATMVIPGVSGSMVLLVLGYYNPIVATIKEFVEALLSFDMPEILRCCGILIPAGIGIVVGIFAIAKLIEILFEKFPLQAYWAIIGLIAASPIAILLVADLGNISVIGVLTSIVTLLIGFVIAMKLGD